MTFNRSMIFLGNLWDLQRCMALDKMTSRTLHNSSISQKLDLSGRIAVPWGKTCRNWMCFCNPLRGNL